MWTKPSFTFYLPYGFYKVSKWKVQNVVYVLLILLQKFTKEVVFDLLATSFCYPWYPWYYKSVLGWSSLHYK